MLKSAVLMMVLLTVITGVIYPFAITAIGYVLFPHQAHGSPLTDNGRVVGSELIGKHVEDPKYFWPRLSATSPSPYNALSSSGSNYGPFHPDLQKAMIARRAALLRADPENTAAVPIDLLTSSASGLDPHISVAGAEFQTGRVARLRGMDTNAVRRLVAEHTEGRQFGFLGEPVVNVLALNRALDSQ